MTDIVFFAYRDFCEVEDKGTTGGCQSNCDQPKPKNGASEQLDRVIGYYEAWRHNSSCQDMVSPRDPGLRPGATKRYPEATLRSNKLTPYRAWTKSQ